MEDVTKHLAEVIGTRPAGTAADHAAAAYIASVMAALGLETSLQEFSFLGWERLSAPEVEILGDATRAVPCGSFLFSGSTPAQGVTGTVEYLGTMYLCPGMFEWPKYAVKDAAGNHLGYLVAHAGGRAINFVLYDLGRQYGCAPYVVIDLPTHEFFQAELAAGRAPTVRMATRGRILPDQKTQNVVGLVKGTELPDEEIVVCAHYDSTLDSRGADDNASGVHAMLRAAEALLARGRPKKNVRFMAFAAEEYLCYGSKYFIETLKERGELHRVKNVVNLDMVGHGDYVWVTAAPESYRRLIERSFAADLAGKLRYEWNNNMVPISDHYHFHAEGIPSAMCICWPYDDYHQASDDYDKVDPELIEKIALGAAGVVARLVGLR